MIKGESASNLWVKLSGPEKEISEAKKLLEIFDWSAQYSRIYQKKKWDGIRKLYASRGNDILIMAGLVDWLAKKLYKAGIEFDYICNIGLDPVLRLDYLDMPLKPRPYQQEVIEATLKKECGLLKLATNAGKTLVASGILKALRDHNCLFIVHRVELFRQTVEYFEGMLKVPIGTLAAGYEQRIENITVGMIATLNARMKTRKDVLEYLHKVDVVIVDESHHGSSDSYSKVIQACKNSRFRIGMSGSFPKEESYQGLVIKGLFGETIYEVSNAQLAEQGVSAPMKVLVLEDCWAVKGLAEAAKVVFMQKSFNPQTKYWQFVYEEGILKNKKRTEAIASIVLGLEGKKGILVLVDRLEHGKDIFDLVKDKSNARFIFGQAEDRKDAFQAFKEGTLDVLVSSPILDEGISVDGIYYLIMAGGGKAERRILQRIGRGLRAKPNHGMLHVFDFYDEGVKKLKAHSEERLEVYAREGFEVCRCTIDDWKEKCQ